MNFQNFAIFVCLISFCVFSRQSFKDLSLYFDRDLIIKLTMFSVIPLPARKRMNSVIQVGKKVFHWGYIPALLYLGFKKGAEKGMPELTVLSLLWG